MMSNRKKPLPNWKNRTLFHKDNLDVMRAMNSETIDLIATDPPFNKNRDFHATPDSLSSGASFQDRWSWEKDIHEDWLDQIKDDNPNLMYIIEAARKSHSDSMGAFLCFIAVRLLAMHRLLKPTGSIYLHCDPTASHYLKMIMDGIFEKENFRNEIIWHYTGGGRSKRYFSRKHDNIFWYSKTSKYVFNVDAVRVPYKETSGYAKSGITSKAGKKYMPHPDGTPVDDTWDIPILNPMSEERTGYPTQKPLALYERIIKASTKANDIVLDPFCGCATTLLAAERLNRQWIGIDLWKKAKDVVLQRMRKEGLTETTSDRRGLVDNDIIATTQLPVRTDDKETSAPFLRVKERIKEPEGEKKTRQEMYEYLLNQHGSKCQGCHREFDDHRYLELDHNTPRSSGGINHISNRILLCSPCNKLKSNTLTLIGLRKENRNRGYMVDSTT